MRNIGKKRRFLRLPYEYQNVKLGKTHEVNVSSSILDRVEARGVGFSELQSYWQLPFHDFAVVSDVITFPDAHNRPLYDTINIISSNPVMLYTMTPNGDKFKNFTLNHFFDTRRQNLIPRLKITALGGKFNRVLAIHDEVTNNLVLAEPDSGTIIPITMSSVFDSVKDLKDRLTGKVTKEEKAMRMLTDFSADNRLVFWTPGGRTVQLMNLEEDPACNYKMDFPFILKSVHPLNEDQWLIVKDVPATEERLQQDGNIVHTKDPTVFYLLKKEEKTDPLPTIVTPIQQTGALSDFLTSLDKKGLSDFGLKLALGEKTSSPNTIFTTSDSYANIAMGFPELEFSASEIYQWPRQDLPTVGGQQTRSGQTGAGKTRFTDPGRDLVYLNDSCQIVRPVATAHVPREGVAGHVATGNCVAFLEVVDLMAGGVRYIPVPEAPHQSPYAAWYKQTYPDKVLALSRMSNDGLVSVDNSGTVR